MTESIHPAAFISLTLLLYIPALWARFLANLDKHFALKLAIFVLYNLFIMFTLRDFINIGYLPLLGVSDSKTLKSWASFMVVAHAFTFILPKRFNRWLMRDKHPTTLFLDIVPKQNTKPTRRQRVSDYGRFLQILFFSIFYTLKILTMILYFAPLNLLPLLITAVLFCIFVTMSFHENRYKKFTHYF
ncbi:Uncharacterised protein [Paucimonas lemoignei]|jgi:hypothetical protein|nr:Uncharacterised protein [Paucimonas lemoignei]